MHDGVDDVNDTVGLKDVGLRKHRHPALLVLQYESIDMASARHPQSLLCYEMYGQALSRGHGAPLRLVMPTKLGYKQAKYVVALNVTSVLSSRRGYWEDQGYTSCLARSLRKRVPTTHSRGWPTQPPSDWVASWSSAASLSTSRSSCRR